MTMGFSSKSSDVRFDLTNLRPHLPSRNEKLAGWEHAGDETGTGWHDLGEFYDQGVLNR